jgi:hypothetical protein
LGHYAGAQSDYTRVLDTQQSLIVEQLRLIAGGPLAWAPAVDGSVVMSVRGGDFELTLGEDLAIGFVSGYHPPQPLVAVGFLSGQAVALLTLALLLSTRLPAIAAGAICVVLFGLGWMAGVFAVIGRFFDAAPLVSAAEASRWLLPSDGLWRGTIYGLEPPAAVLLAIGRAGPASLNPFFASSPPPAEFLAWSAVWVVIVLGLSVVSLARRDL